LDHIGGFMFPNTTQEQQLRQELQGLDQDSFEKIMRMIHFMKKEILNVKHARLDTEIIQYAGLLNDISDDEADRFSAAIQRTSMFGQRDTRI
jgi:pantothenate kinase-related protein Tda10